MLRGMCCHVVFCSSPWEHVHRIFFSVQCDDGYVLSSDGQECRKCSDKNCGSCSKDGKQCFSCAYGYGLDKKTKQCVKCKQDTCTECTKDASVCTMCGYKGSITYDVIGGKCVACPAGASKCANSKVTSCQYGYYLDKTSKSCKKCQPVCNECTDGTSCTSCKYGYDLSKSGQCIACPPNAYACITKLSCIQGYFPVESSNSCVKCPIELMCQECASTTTCASCYQDRQLTSDGTCAPKSSSFESEGAPAEQSASSRTMVGIAVAGFTWLSLI